MSIPVIFVNPITQKMDSMPDEMIGAYLYDYTDLDLEAAAKVATIRDQEAADNLLLSVIECTLPDVEMIISEGTETDLLSIESPSTR
jgi:hypothetical protein